MIKNPNHPKRNSVIRVDPIRNPEDIERIRNLLKDRLRDLCIFDVGINTNLRAGDLLSIKVGQVRYLKPGDCLELREQKTRKKRVVFINARSYHSIQALLNSKKMKHSKNDEYIFKSRIGGGKLRVNSLNSIIKKIGKDLNIKSNLGCHTLRKTWAVQLYFNQGVSLAHIMKFMNHSSERISLQYLGITPQSEIDILMKEI